MDFKHPQHIIDLDLEKWFCNMQHLKIKNN